MPDARPPQSMLITMPQGLGVNGVVIWGLRLAHAMADRGWSVAIAAHGEPPGHARIDHQLPPNADFIDLRRLPPIDAPGQPLGPVVAAYRSALEGLGWSAANPAIVLPSLEANCYAAVAALAATHADHLRVVGWQHSDTAFDATLLRTYEPMLSALVGVSQHITRGLRASLLWRDHDVFHVPYGVEVLHELPQREAGPRRLLYAGRLEHEQKRIGVLLRVARTLEARGVEHRFRFVGDGPAREEVESALADLPSATLHPPASGEALRAHFAWADATLLASRYEGLSIAMLEAMAAGVAPIVTRVRSGTAEAIDHGRQGVLIDPEGDDDLVASRFVEAISSLGDDELATMRARAHRRACERYAISTHADACARVFEHATLAEPRWWPLDRPCTFTSSHAIDANGSVPPDAAHRAAKALATIQGPIAIYGAGRHTLAIAQVLAHANVACVIDDDPKNHGATLWGWPVVGLEDSPEHAPVLISSYMHADTMARRCVAAGRRPINLY